MDGNVITNPVENGAEYLRHLVLNWKVCRGQWGMSGAWTRVTTAQSSRVVQHHLVRLEYGLRRSEWFLCKYGVLAQACWVVGGRRGRLGTTEVQRCVGGSPATRSFSQRNLVAPL